ncbi:unnamed protein product [Microthlaspi erraticum]|uniref:Uncharacterized protein n=1 Tax=Microthlaspi erraticum TaxID=1685480 RepID=A0A6D2KB80_9BRAS|nr:unnamed protein product [Microthlaspi erraticum]
MSHHHAQAIHNHPSSPDINKTPLFPRESYQAARQTKIEDMLQEYLRNQEESTKKMERRIDFIHESLGNKSEVLFKQVIKLDEDIKKLREDHDRSLTLVKLDVASKYQELLNKSMRIEDTSYGNSKHLGSSTTAYKPLKDHLMPITRERGVQHPTTLPFIAMPSQEEALLKSMRTMKKKKESMRNN